MKLHFIALTLSMVMLAGGGVLAQTEDASTAIRLDTLTAFQQEQWALIDEQNALLEKGATTEQLATWRKQNAARFEAQLQRAKEISDASASRRPTPVMSSIRIPANASPELREYLLKQAELQNRSLQQQSPQGQGQTKSINGQGRTQEATAEIQEQMQRAKVITQQNVQRTFSAPMAPRIPVNASPELRVFLTEQHQLMVDRVAFDNQYRNATPEIREAAFKEWQKQNATRLQSIQQHAQNLAQETQR